MPSFSLLWLLYPCFFFNFDPLVRLRSHVYLLISSMHRFHVFHTDFPNDRSQIQGRTLTPEFSLDWPCKAFSGTQILLIVIHMSLSTPLITTPHPHLPSVLVPSSLKPRTAFHFCIVSLLNRELFLPFAPSGRPLGCAPGRCVSCSRRSAPLDAPSFLFHHEHSVF